MLVARPLAVLAVPRRRSRFNWRGKDLHRLDRPARRGRDLPRLDPDAGRPVKGLSVFRRRLRRRHHLAVAAGLDAGAGGTRLHVRAAARRARSAARRAGSARPARAAAGRLSGAAEKPVFPPRPDPVLVEADAGDPRRAHPNAERGRSDRARRLHLSAGAAGTRRGAGPLLRRHNAVEHARSASARRLHGVRRAYARRSSPRSTGSRSTSTRRS